MAESLRVHSLIARAALHSRASAGCNFGQTAGPSLIKFGTREGGREGGREGREGRGGEGRGGGDRLVHNNCVLKIGRVLFCRRLFGGN